METQSKAGLDSPGEEIIEDCKHYVHEKTKDTYEVINNRERTKLFLFRAKEKFSQIISEISIEAEMEKQKQYSENQALDIEECKNKYKQLRGVEAEVAPPGEHKVCLVKGDYFWKHGQPKIISLWFKVMEGDYKDCFIFYTQRLTTGYGISAAHNFIHSLNSDINITFGEKIGNKFEQIKEKTENKEYVLEYTLNTDNSLSFIIKNTL